MKKKPAILFLLPVLLLLTGSSLKAGATDRATSALATYTWLADGTKCSSERPAGLTGGEIASVREPACHTDLSVAPTLSNRFCGRRRRDV